MDVASGRRHTLLVSDCGSVYACGENKGGVLGNVTKKLGMCKQFEQMQDRIRKKPLKWFPSMTMPSGNTKGGSDFKISQVACGDGASYAREVSPIEGEMSVEALGEMIEGVDRMIESGGGTEFEGNAGLLELRAHLREQR